MYSSLKLSSIVTSLTDHFSIRHFVYRETVTSAQVASLMLAIGSVVFIALLNRPKNLTGLEDL